MKQEEPKQKGASAPHNTTNIVYETINIVKGLEALNRDSMRELILETVKECMQELIVEGIKEYKRYELKMRKKTTYHNTEVLLKNYGELKQHADNAVYKLSEESEDMRNDLEEKYSHLDPDEIQEYKDLYVDSILKTKIRTAIMVQQIDMALFALKMSAAKEGYTSKYDVLMAIYIEHKKLEDLSEAYHCSGMTISRWRKEMIRKLGVLLFGSEGLILGA